MTLGFTKFAPESEYSIIYTEMRLQHNVNLNSLPCVICAGCKWTLQQLRQHIRQAGINDWLLWQKISVLVSLTLASQCTAIPNTSNCFELYGFDILVDSDLKPWLLEVCMVNIFRLWYFTNTT